MLYRIKITGSLPQRIYAAKLIATIKAMRANAMAGNSDKRTIGGRTPFGALVADAERRSQSITVSPGKSGRQDHIR